MPGPYVNPGDIIPFPVAVADGVTARLHSINVDGLVDAIKEAIDNLCTCLDRVELDSVSVESISFSGGVATAGEWVQNALNLLRPGGPMGAGDLAEAVLKSAIASAIEDEMADALSVMVAYVNQGSEEVGGWLQTLPLPDEIKALIKECPVQCADGVISVTAKATVSVVQLSASVTLNMKFHYYLTQLEVVHEARSLLEDLERIRDRLKKLGLPLPGWIPGGVYRSPIGLGASVRREDPRVVRAGSPVVGEPSNVGQITKFDRVHTSAGNGLSAAVGTDLVRVDSQFLPGAHAELPDRGRPTKDDQDVACPKCIMGN